MKQPPRQIGGARLVQWAVINDRHQPTGSCRHIVGGTLQSPAAGLAICQYDGEDAYYLFGCDANWGPVTDTWHETLEDARQQAECEYQGVSTAWNVVLQGDHSDRKHLLSEATDAVADDRETEAGGG